MSNGWHLNGNAISQGDFLGTTNGQPLSIRSAGTERLRLDTNGNIQLIGNQARLESGGKSLDLRSDGADVDIQSQTSSVFIHSSGPGRNNVVLNPFGGEGNVGVGTTAPGTKLEVAGDITANDVVLTSDARLKADITPVEGAMEKLQKIRGVHFTWLNRDDSGFHGSVGVLAQEVEPVFPELVDTHNSEGYKGVSYAGLTAVLIQAFKELLAENLALKHRIEAVERTAAHKDRRTMDSG